MKLRPYSQHMWRSRKEWGCWLTAAFTVAWEATYIPNLSCGPPLSKIGSGIWRVLGIEFLNPALEMVARHRGPSLSIPFACTGFGLVYS